MRQKRECDEAFHFSNFEDVGRPKVTDIANKQIPLIFPITSDWPPTGDEPYGLIP
jgi:hypothetical protein